MIKLIAFCLRIHIAFPIVVPIVVTVALVVAEWLAGNIADESTDTARRFPSRLFFWLRGSHYYIEVQRLSAVDDGFIR